MVRPTGEGDARGQATSASAGSRLSLPRPEALSPRLSSASSADRVETTSRGTAGVEAAAEDSSPDRIIRHRPSPSGTADPAREQLPLGRAGSAGGSVWATAWPLLTVLALIGLIAYVIKRYTPARRMLTGAGVVDIVARTFVSPKQSLVLVKMGQRLVLLGVCPDRISALAHVDDPDEAALLLGQAASRRPDSISHQFVEAFREQASAYVEQDEDVDSLASPASSVRALLEKIRQLARKRGVA